MVYRRTPTRSGRTAPRRGPERCRSYLAWIRTLPCAVCLRAPDAYLRVEAAHTNTLGPRGVAQKSSDFSAIPLCFWHHRGNPDSYHQLGEHGFAQRHGIDLAALVRGLNELYPQSWQGMVPEGRWDG